jgi:hypothetical protein
MNRALAAAFSCLALSGSGWLFLFPASANAQTGSCPNAALRVGPSAGLPDCRGLELVSPSQKVGGTGVGVWYQGPAANGFTGVAAYDPDSERFAVQADVGSVLTNGAFAFANDWALAQRTAAGWVSKPAATRGGYGSQDYRFLNISAASEDLSTMGWNSNGGLLRLFPEMESWSESPAGNPTFMRSWEQDRWDLFGVTDVSQNEKQDDGTGGTVFDRIAISADGERAVGSGPVRGLAGIGDPTHPSWPDGYAAKSGNVYLFDMSGGLTDAFPAAGDSRRSLVNVCTAGTEIPQRSALGEQGAQPCPATAPGRDAALISPYGAALGDKADRAISRNGSRVFFMSPNPLADLDPGTAAPETGACVSNVVGVATACPAQLYVRQRNSDGSVTTRWISRSRTTAVAAGAFGGGMIADQDASLMSPVFFEGASSDGSRVFFRTKSPLTPDDPNGGCGGNPLPCTSGNPAASSSDLYMYELPAGPDGDPATPDVDPGDGTLTRISAGPTGSSDCDTPFRPTNPDSSSSVSAARFIDAAGGERAYFVCDVPLAGVPGSSDGTVTVPSPSPSVTNEFGVVIHTAANLYLYDAAKPLAERWRFVAQLPRASGPSFSTPDERVAACATTATQTGSLLTGGIGEVGLDGAADCVRGVPDGSFITFMTLGQLTADDTDTAADIYAYDAAADELVRVTSAAPGATGGSYACSGDVSIQCNGDQGIGSDAAAVRRSLPALGVASDGGDRMVFFQSRSRLVPEDVDDAYDVYRWRNGELSLVSTWASGPDGAFFVGNDRKGRNVYVTSRDRLTWQDTDAVLDVYTARVDGGFAEPDPPPPPCDPVGAGCHGAGADGPAGGSPATRAPGGGNAAAGARARLSLRGPSPGQRRRAARTGVVPLRVRVSKPGELVAVAKARLGNRTKRVGRASKTLTKPDSVATLRVRLDGAARERLSTGARLRMSVKVRMPGALPRTADFTLRRVGR